MEQKPVENNSTTKEAIKAQGGLSPKKTSRAFFVIPVIIILLFVKMGFDSYFGSRRLEGYVEGEFTYISSAVDGRLETLAVERGAEVSKDALLFELEKTQKQSVYDEANEKLGQAQAALDFAQKEFARQETLLGQKIATQQNYDSAKNEKDQAEKNVAQLRASLANARWAIDQTTQRAPAQGIAFDTLYRVGEWVKAGSPVVTLLTPQGIRVRAFVDEKRLAKLSYGSGAKIFIDGEPRAFEGKVVYIAPAAEYTPPVIYSQESRSKFVWRVDIGFDDATAMKLHPGQPVEVEL